jgi:hypothetical protein
VLNRPTSLNTPPDIVLASQRLINTSFWVDVKEPFSCALCLPLQMIGEFFEIVLEKQTARFFHYYKKKTPIGLNLNIAKTELLFVNRIVNILRIGFWVLTRLFDKPHIPA